jgi:hypothetical protein
MWEGGLAGALLLVFVLIRWLAARNHSVALIEPEEFLNLRLAQQWLADLPLGPLGDYWYSGVGGPTGAGTLVLSLLFVPLVWLFGAGEPVLRLMGSLWALGGALLLAGIAGELFGPRGRLAGLVAAVTMPPAWVGFTLMARGNYVEAAVLSLLGLYLLLLTARFPPSRSRQACALGLGWALGFAVWFCPSAWPPSAGLFILAVAIHAGQRRRLLLLLGAGLGLASLPALLGLAPSDRPADPVAALDHLAALRDLLTSPGSWPRFITTNLASMPLLDNWSPDLGGAAAIGEAPAWAADWQSLLRPIQRLLNWIVLAVVGTTLLRRPSQLHRGIGAGVLGLGLGLPLLLGAIGVGPASLSVEQVYFFEPRRAALVYPLWALAWAGVFATAWDWPGARQNLTRGVAATVALFALASVAQFAFGGPGRPEPFQPERYVICPQEQPRDQSAICIGLLLTEHLLVLEEALQEPRFAATALRRHLLLGFGAVDLENPRCSLPPEGPPESPQESGSPDTDPAGLTWEGVGLALGASCSPQQAQSICLEAKTETLQRRCMDAATRAQRHQR